MNSARAIGTRQMSGQSLQAKIKAKQEFFQVYFVLTNIPFHLTNSPFNLQKPDGLLVHEKTASDRFLFQFTTLVTIISVGMTFKFFYDFSFPKKP